VDLRPGYRELEPPAAARGALACLRVRVVPPQGASPTRVLPDAYVDLIWQAGRSAFVAGPDTGPSLIAASPGAIFVGSRFLPGAGGPALGIPLDEVRNERVATDVFWPELSDRLPATLSPSAALLRVAAPAIRLTTAGPPDPAVRAAARRLADSHARVGSLAGDLGLSERQLRRRCHAAVG
jgi:hypothetical protein